MRPTTAFFTSLLLSASTFAATTYYPGNTDGLTATDLKSKPPVYYPPPKPNPMINPETEAQPNENTNNPQLPQQQLPTPSDRK